MHLMRKNVKCSPELFVYVRAIMPVDFFFSDGPVGRPLPASGTGNFLYNGANPAWLLLPPGAPLDPL